MYSSPMADIFWKHGLKYHCYADDTQIYVLVDPTRSNVNDAIGLVSVSRYMARLRVTGADWGLDIKNNI